jgi:cell division protein ZapE
VSDSRTRRSALRKRYDAELATQGFSADPAQQQALETLDLLRARLIRAERDHADKVRKLLRSLRVGKPAATVRGVYLWGSVGRGKTWLMDLFYQSLPFERRQRSHFHRFMQDVHAGLKRHAKKTDPLAPVAADIAQKCRVLCLDELFVSDIADAMLLGNLFQHLSANGVTLVFTSNVPPQGLYRNGLQRQRFLPAIAHLEQNLDVVAVDGSVDYRLRQLIKARIYLDSADAATPAALQMIYDDLADDEADDGTRQITVLGRRIPVVRASDNVIWFEFAAICGGPRGPTDYIEIAREYQSVLVTGIPVLAAADDNDARRFIALVDEFYDRGVKLIVSAAAPPAALYRGERLKFEFERAASRLVEMQTKRYLARPHLT